ncbi:hypothetical protein KP79_PYT06803 [Mizuhopecten yessoensis]|uniref:Ig-like domain-containing protein n=1 Tax=Mizuhopecten yessoensis TaxID=6573 RepID=A0A210QI81_MIZYE|nr:hypothetical protein KP79_PYT06803 [Mizuhopecten yessoensis]
MTLWYLLCISTLVNMHKAREAMDSRRDGLNVLGYTYMAVLMFAYITDAAGTVCSDAVTDGTMVLNMCEDGNAVGKRVVIDTYGSSAYRTDGGSINCSCTATMTGRSDGISSNVLFDDVQSLYPPSGCGSSVILSAHVAAVSSVQSTTFVCTVGFTKFYLGQTNDTFIVVWQSGPSGSTSEYCLSSTASTGAYLSVKCFEVNDKSEENTTPPPTSPATVMLTSDQKPSPISVTSPSTSSLASYFNGTNAMCA